MIAIKKEKHKKLAISIAGFLLSIPIFSLTASADTTSIIQNFPREQNSLFSNILRQLAWYIVIGLHWMVVELEKIVYQVNDVLGGFFVSSGMVNLENKVLPIAVALIGVVIVFIGIQTMIKPQQTTTIVGNFIVGVIIAIALPSLLTQAYNFTTQAITYINSDSDGKMQNMGDKILLENITDTTRYDQAGFKSTTLPYKSYYAMPKANGSKITSIDPVEIVNPDNMKYPDAWKNKVVTDQNGKQTLQELGNGTFGFITIPMMSEYYYRWNIDWFNIIVTLLITAVSLALSSLKIARLLYELAIHQVMTQICGLLDVVTAQRLKKCIQSLLATFGTLFGVFFMLQVYIIGMGFIQNVSNIILKLILMLALAWAVIDGPNLFEQILGVDAGIHSAMRTMYGLKAAGGLVTGGVAALGGGQALNALKTKGLIGATKSIAGKAGIVAGSVGGAAAGAIGGMKDTSKRVQSVKSAATQAGTKAGISGTKTAAASTGSATTSSPNSKSHIGTSNAGQGLGGSSTVSNNSSFHDESEPSSSMPQENDTASPSYSSPDVQPSSSTTNTENQASADSPEQVSPETLGQHFRSAVASKVKQSSVATSARHAYSLTRNSAQAHGNKKVNMEGRIQNIQNSNPDATRLEAKQQAKKDIRSEKKGTRNQRHVPEESWLEQEREAERKNQLH